jgi:hypothetical protein
MFVLLQKRGFNDLQLGPILHKYYPILTFESGEQVIQSTVLQLGPKTNI